MAIYITEYARLAVDLNGYGIAAGDENGTPVEQIRTITGTSSVSAAFNEQTRFIMVHTSEVCSIKIGWGTPVAVVTAHRLAANETRFYGVDPGMVLAGITNT